MSKKNILTEKEIEHWLGHNFMHGDSTDCQDWLPDLISRLANKELTFEEIVEEIKQMYKDYMLDRELQNFGLSLDNLLLKENDNDK